MDFSPEAHFFEQEHGFIIASSTFKRCKLCQLDVPQAEMLSHIEEESHMSSFDALTKVAADEQVLYQRRIEVLSWKARISSLHNTSTEDIYRAALDYLTDVGVDSTAVTIPLDRREAMERSVSIKLVAWKATCIMSTPSNVNFRSVLDCYAWIKSGWKAVKEEMRKSPAIAVIQSNVTSYLQPSLEGGRGRMGIPVQAKVKEQ
jgi:hypothetical protein